MTVIWHVDDLKTSHKNVDTVDDLISKLSERYRKVADSTTHQGKVHEYMGMKLDYRERAR